MRKDCANLQGFTLQNSLKLAQQIEGILCGRNVLKRGVDEGLHAGLQCMDVDIELQKVPIKLIPRVVQQIIWLALDVIYNVVEVPKHLFQAIDVSVRLKGGELDHENISVRT